MRIAVISDIHSNTFALKEVLKDIESKNVDSIINLGDSLYGSIDPLGTARILMESNIVSIAGNQDEIIIDDNASLKDNQSLVFVRSKIADEKILTWLKSLPNVYTDFSRIIRK